MKSIWALVTDHASWLRYVDARPEMARQYPEQFPCLVRPVIEDIAGRVVVPLFVYKQEADALALVPLDPKHYNPEHPMPEIA